MRWSFWARGPDHPDYIRVGLGRDYTAEEVIQHIGAKGRDGYVITFTDGVIQLVDHDWRFQWRLERKES